MTTARRNRPTDLRELLLAGETPPPSKEAWGTALELYFFDRHLELPQGIEAHLRCLLDRWGPEAKAGGW